jgi:hypothetical protein
MTVGQERLAEVVAEILGPERLAQQLGVEQLILMLRYLKPDITKEELKNLLTQAAQKGTTITPSQSDQNPQPAPA